jgi:biofilm PGA synthesis N-glycosyltransferase PgaC
MVRAAAEIAIAFVALYPVMTAAVWVAGGLLFRILDEANDAMPPAGGWPGVTVLIPAYNEEAVIAESVRGALASDYPNIQVLVLDDGSVDRTADEAESVAGGDPRLEVIRDPVNRGKGARLNRGFRQAGNELVAVIDADTNMHPLALKLLVARICRSSRIAAVAGGPHVNNRTSLLSALQILEAAAIIGLIRRSQALAGRVGTVAGVLGLFRRDAVLSVGGYDARMATEDIDLSWRLLLAGWHTGYEPGAMVGMEVPTTFASLWAQRCRWARGQGEVLRVHLGAVRRWRNRKLWPLAAEAIASLVWVVLAAAALMLAVVATLAGSEPEVVGLTIAWGVAISVVATIQLAFAIAIRARYDRRGALAFVLGPLYPLGYWAISATAALRSELPALVRGPAKRHVAWNLPRERIEA